MAFASVGWTPSRPSRGVPPNSGLGPLLIEHGQDEHAGGRPQRCSSSCLWPDDRPTDRTSVSQCGRQRPVCPVARARLTHGSGPDRGDDEGTAHPARGQRRSGMPTNATRARPNAMTTSATLRQLIRGSSHAPDRRERAWPSAKTCVAECHPSVAPMRRSPSRSAKTGTVAIANVLANGHERGPVEPATRAPRPALPRRT
jgi:hypothetical protein